MRTGDRMAAGFQPMFAGKRPGSAAKRRAVHSPPGKRASSPRPKARNKSAWAAGRSSDRQPFHLPVVDFLQAVVADNRRQRGIRRQGLPTIGGTDGATSRSSSAAARLPGRPTPGRRPASAAGSADRCGRETRDRPRRVIEGSRSVAKREMPRGLGEEHPAELLLESLHKRSAVRVSKSGSGAAKSLARFLVRSCSKKRRSLVLALRERSRSTRRSSRSPRSDRLPRRTSLTRLCIRNRMMW